MTPEEWEKVEALFSSALALPAAERREHLKRSVGADARLRADVEELLHAHGDNAGFLSAPLWAVADAHGDADDTADDGDRVPERIGPYQVLRRIGRGGMGQVFLAEREAHDVRLQVALKVMRRGMDSADLVKRFKMERLILASLDHAHIARLLDVGVTDTGAPYIVMEYVQGESILAFADRARLSVVDRLALFKGICAAVQHAHRRLVVHRDLKPQNILVNADGVPKLLDFGIARILDADAGSDGAMHTDANARLLTPGYAAPEQLRGEPVTTACDVYALGVLLYELLAGCHPFAYDGAARAIVQQRVLETEPAPPSTRTSHECAANRRTSVSSLRTTLRGDLDTIVLKALRKEAEHRYGSASALDDDLDRYLHGQPVRARSATRRYRVGKFVQRNRAFVAVAAVLMAVLVASSALTAYQARRIGQEAARVASERDKALEVRTFLLEIFGTTGPDQPTGDSVTARALLDRRAATLGTSIRADDTSNTDLRAEMMSVLAEGYEKLGLLTNAEPLAGAGGPPPPPPRGGPAPPRRRWPPHGCGVDEEQNKF